MNDEAEIRAYERRLEEQAAEDYEEEFAPDGRRLTGEELLEKRFNVMNTPNFSHEYPRDDEWEHTVNIKGHTVSVSAVGGGTVGKTYDLNYWHYKVEVPGDEPFCGSDLRIGTADHFDAAEVAFDLMGDY